MTHTFTLPIGDWSDDGHGQCVYFTCKSNKPVEEVREAHFKMKEVLGFSIEEFANDYRDTSVPENIKQWLMEHGLNVGPYGISVEDMAEAWALMLEAADPELELTVSTEQPPMLPFYGVRDGKHIGQVGYGIF